MGARPAVTGARFQAVLLDHGLALVLTAAVAALASTAVADPTAPAGAVVYSGLLYAPVFVGFKSATEARYGRSPGKAARNLAVRSADGGRCPPAGALVRNLLLAVDWLPAAYLLGAGVAFRTEENRRVGDLVAGTVVVAE